MKEIYNAEDEEHARTAIKTFERDYGAKYPKAVAKIINDADTLLEFYSYPAEHRAFSNSISEWLGSQRSMLFLAGVTGGVSRRGNGQSSG